MLQKLLIICPKFGEKNNALSAHSEILTEYLSHANSVTILTSKYSNRSYSRDINPDLLELDGKWSFINLLKFFKQIKNDDYQTILVQYVPFLYGRAGINFSFPIFVVLLRLFTKSKVEVYFHELYYPFELKIKSMIMNISHLIMLIMLGSSAHKILTTTKRFQKILKIILSFKNKIYYLPVGTNIKKIEIEASEILKVKQKIGITVNDYVLGSFGTFHPSKNYPLIFKILEIIKEQGQIPIKFLMMGQDIDAVKTIIDEKSFNKVKDCIVATGKIDDYEVNIFYQIMDCYIGYFVDGISSRRGSIISAMEAGLPIISTKNDNTASLFQNHKNIYLFSTDTKQFQDDVIELLNDFCDNIKNQGKIKHKLFEEVFSWEKIINLYEKYSSE